MGKKVKLVSARTMFGAGADGLTNSRRLLTERDDHEVRFGVYFDSYKLSGRVL
jgi:hypothetical protein